MNITKTTDRITPVNTITGECRCTVCQEEGTEWHFARVQTLSEFGAFYQGVICDKCATDADRRFKFKMLEEKRVYQTV